MTQPQTQPIKPGSRIAIAGATGYVGGRLVPALLEAGYQVRCMVRDPRKIQARPWSNSKNLEVVTCDLENRAQIESTLKACAAAYYLVHTMISAGSDFADKDQTLATTFGQAAHTAGVQRLIYLGGLGDESRDLSKHLESRREVETALRAGGVPLTTLRAAMIIGSGSASFEILRYLVERLPMMVTPKWVRTETQPIAIHDVVTYLTRCLSVPETAGRDLDIGGSDVVSYDRLMRIMAEQLGLPRRLVIPVGVLSPSLSSRWIHLITPIGHRLARPLAEGLRNRLVCRNDDAAELMPGPRLSSEQAIHRALADYRAGDTPTSWRDAGAMPGDPDWSGGTTLTDQRERTAYAPISAVFEGLTRIGGKHGYFSSSLLWRVRGLLDWIVGGPGLRRGRRSPATLQCGDAVDFWRVTTIEPGKRLELTAEMRLPGEARVEWTLESRPGNRTLVTQTAKFRPKGLLGLAYWYSISPLHAIVFNGMLRGICRTPESQGEGPPPSRPTRGLRLLRRETIVPRNLKDTFAFFSDAHNLDLLTPASVQFQILTPAPIPMKVGALIDYRIRIRGIPVNWRTEIIAWNPPGNFIDLQLKGPYRWWHHEHRFETCNEGTRIIDEVEYAAPLGWLTCPLFINREVASIFDYRATALHQHFGAPDQEADAPNPTPAKSPTTRAPQTTVS